MRAVGVQTDRSRQRNSLVLSHRRGAVDDDGRRGVVVLNDRFRRRGVGRDDVGGVSPRQKRRVQRYNGYNDRFGRFGRAVIRNRQTQLRGLLTGGDLNIPQSGDRLCRRGIVTSGRRGPAERVKDIKRRGVRTAAAGKQPPGGGGRLTAACLFGRAERCHRNGLTVRLVGDVTGGGDGTEIILRLAVKRITPVGENRRTFV